MKPEYSISFLFFIFASTLLLVDSAPEKVVVKIGAQNATSTTTMASLNTTLETTTETLTTSSELPGAEMVNLTEIVSSKPEPKRTGRNFGKDKDKEGGGYGGYGGYPQYPYPPPYQAPPPCYPYYG